MHLPDECIKLLVMFFEFEFLYFETLVDSLKALMHLPDECIKLLVECKESGIGFGEALFHGSLEGIQSFV